MLSKLLLIRYKCLFPVVTIKMALPITNVLRVKTASVRESKKKKKGKDSNSKERSLKASSFQTCRCTSLFSDSFEKISVVC